MAERKRRVMIACVTFETVKVSDPVDYYGANVVYIIHHVRDPSSDNVYQQFFDRTCELISEGRGDVKVIGVDRNVSDFTGLLSTINTIITAENSKGSEIYINLSSGSPEFTAAGATAAMMDPAVKAFFVHADEYTVSNSDIRRIYYRDGKPVGLTSSVRDTEELPEFRLEMPDETLVRALRRYSARLSEGRVIYSDMIADLIDHGLWVRRDSSSNSNNDKVFFQRRYIEEWRDRGWIEKEGSGYRISEKGRMVLRILYPEGDVEGD